MSSEKPSSLLAATKSKEHLTKSTEAEGTTDSETTVGTNLSPTFEETQDKNQVLTLSFVSKFDQWSTAVSTPMLQLQSTITNHQPTTSSKSDSPPPSKKTKKIRFAKARRPVRLDSDLILESHLRCRQTQSKSKPKPKLEHEHKHKHKHRKILKHMPARYVPKYRTPSRGGGGVSGIDKPRALSLLIGRPVGTPDALEKSDWSSTDRRGRYYAAPEPILAMAAVAKKKDPITKKRVLSEMKRSDVKKKPDKERGVVRVECIDDAAGEDENQDGDEDDDVYRLVDSEEDDDAGDVLYFDFSKRETKKKKEKISKSGMDFSARMMANMHMIGYDKRSTTSRHASVGDDDGGNDLVLFKARQAAKREKERAKKVCGRCWEEGHVTKECTLQHARCSLCFDDGHHATRCPKIRCDICNEMGHDRSICHLIASRRHVY